MPSLGSTQYRVTVFGVLLYLLEQPKEHWIKQMFLDEFLAGLVFAAFTVAILLA